MRGSAFAELVGTTGLLITVVGSGIMAERLSAGNDGVALLANAIATGVMLYVMITTLGPLSGAHFNPAVTLLERLQGRLSNVQAVQYLAAQVIGAVLGVIIAHAMFELPFLQVGTHVRQGPAQILSEAIATAGLLLTIGLGVRHRPDKVPLLVACYITGAYWFTSSTSFANPAVTLARSLTDTFAGIRPQDIGGFVLGQLIGVGVAMGVLALLLSRTTDAQSGAQGDADTPDSKPTDGVPW